MMRGQLAVTVLAVVAAALLGPTLAQEEEQFEFLGLGDCLTEDEGTLDPTKAPSSNDCRAVCGSGCFGFL